MTMSTGNPHEVPCPFCASPPGRTCDPTEGSYTVVNGGTWHRERVAAAAGQPVVMLGVPVREREPVWCGEHQRWDDECTTRSEERSLVPVEVPPTAPMGGGSHEVEVPGLADQLDELRAPKLVKVATGVLVDDPQTPSIVTVPLDVVVVFPSGASVVELRDGGLLFRGADFPPAPEPPAPAAEEPSPPAAPEPPVHEPGSADQQSSP